MNTAYTIAKRIAFNKEKSFSRFIIRLSVFATALSVAAMIITISFVNGFQKTIAEKVFNFWGHIRVQHYESTKALIAEESPIDKNDTVERIIQQQYGVKSLQAFATKSAVLEKNKAIEGILLKGVDNHFDGNTLAHFIQSGRMIEWKDSLYAREIVLSTTVANTLKLQLGDTVNIYFISVNEGKSTRRPLKVVGLFKTGIEEYDKQFALGDIRLIRRINNWDSNKIGGYEVMLSQYPLMDTISYTLTEKLPSVWVSRTIKEVYPNIFEWLGVQDLNRNVIITIMAIVAIINLITCLLILVLERTKMVGILKAVGARNGLIQQIFVYYASIITVVGVGIGLIVGVGVCLLQESSGFIKLDESMYSISVASVEIVWWQVALVGGGTSVVCFLSLIIPSAFVRKIAPVKAIAFR